MTDTIDNNVIQKVAESVIHQTAGKTVHTLIIELNGAHGGVDVTAHMTVPYQVDYTVGLAELKHTWSVR